MNHKIVLFDNLFLPSEYHMLYVQMVQVIVKIYMEILEHNLNVMVYNIQLNYNELF
jgi:hypothetical protein